MAAVPPVGSGPGCPYGLSPAGRSMVNCFEKTLLCFVSQNQMWFYHAQKALSMIFLKKNLKNQCAEYQPEYRCKILWCTVHDGYYGSYCSADPCTAGDRPAERCRSCSNPSSRVRLKMPGKTKTSAYFYTLRFFGGRGWMSRAALLKTAHRAVFAPSSAMSPQLFESTLESET